MGFSPDGKRLVATTDSLVAVLDSATGAVVRRITVDRPLIADLDLSRDGTRIALAIDERHGGNHWLAGSAQVLELASGAELGRRTLDNAVFAVAFSPDASLALCEGVNVTRRPVLARWFDGSSHSWVRREKGPGSGESSSGLAFDTVRPTGPWPG